MNKLLKIAGAALFAAFLAHIVWSALMAQYAAALYSHRAPDVVQINNENGNWTGILSAFANTRSPNVMFVGSSFSFGYSFHTSVIFSKHMSFSAQSVNMSVVGATSYDIKKLAKCALKHAPAVDTVIVEIPLINDAGELVKIHNGASPRIAHQPCRNTENSYFEFLTRRPFGFNWLRLLRDKYYDREPRNIVLAPLPKDFVPSASEYEKVSEKIDRERTALIETMQRLGKRVVVFQSPIFVDGLVELGFNRTNIEHQLRDGIEPCHRIARRLPNIHCVDTYELRNRRELFRDIAHLSVRGHRLFAQWLERQISPPFASEG